MDEKNLNGTNGAGDEDTWLFDASSDLLEPQAFNLLKRTIAKNFKQYGVWVCQAALGIEEPGMENPLLVRKEGKPVPLAPFYRDVASILLEGLTGRPRPAKTAFEEYWSIGDWIAYKVTERGELRPVNVETYYDDVGRLFLIRDFFSAQLNRFEYVARCALILVYHGVPLYRPNDAATRMELLPYSHEDYIYLSKKGQHFDPVGMDEFPFWTQEYYFKLAHLEAERLFFKEQKLFFSDEELSFNEDKLFPEEDASDLTVEQVGALRGSYRRYIGIEAPQDKLPAPGKPPTFLMGLLNKVRERYYGPEYIENDPDTWPKQRDVIDWLRSTYNISGREAESIDVVARPDLARRKSR